MRAIGEKIGVIFDDTHLKSYDLGNGIKLERAESWLAKEGDEETHSKVETNVNHLYTNPQIATVAVENDSYNHKEGDLVFLHYLAYEMFEEFAEINGKQAYLIDQQFVLLTIKNGEYILEPNKYLGEIFINEPPKTTSGIYLTSQESVKDSMKVIITHVPEVGEFKIGDVVIPVDSSHYIINLYGKDYVLLKEDEIVAKYESRT